MNERKFVGVQTAEHTSYALAYFILTCKLFTGQKF